MTNKEKAMEIANDETLYDNTDENSKIDECFISALVMAKFKDNQPISKLGGWNTEPPTEDGCYLVESKYIQYKNSEFLVAEYDTSAQCWYDEAFENPIEIERWKRI